jgi:ABC-type lipoprotein export system ATPase subunit
MLGKKISHMKKEKRGLIRSRHLGMVYQIWYWVKSLNVIDNVSIPLLLQGYDFKNAREKSYEMLKMIRMDNFANKSPLHLSGGEQQRICLARALVNNPEIIIADEPTGNLDTRNADEIMQIFNNLNKEQKKTVVIVTHNLSYLSMTDKTIGVKDGEIVDSEELLKEIGEKA